MFVNYLRFTLLAALVTTAVPLAAQVQPPPGVMALAVGSTPGTGDPEWVTAGQGLGDILIVDIGQLIQPGGARADCSAIQVEWRRRAEIIAEVELEQSDLFDPATRATPGQMIEPTVMITGTSNDANGTISYTFEMRSHPDGALIASVSGSAKNTEIFDATTKIASDILDQLCKKGWTASGGGPRIKITGTVKSIAAAFTLDGLPTGGTALFTYAPGGAEGGTVSYTVVGGGATGNGQGTYTIKDTGGGTYQINQTTNGCMHGIPNSCKTNSEVITLTPIN